MMMKGSAWVLVGWGALGLVACSGSAWNPGRPAARPVAQPPQAAPVAGLLGNAAPREAARAEESEALPPEAFLPPPTEPLAPSPPAAPEAAPAAPAPMSAGTPPADEELAAALEDWGNVEELEEVTVHDPDQPGDHWYGDTYARVERGLNIPFGRTIRPGTFLFSIDHRNFQGVDEEPLRDFFGFDGGNLKIGIGLRYGITDRLDAGVYRVNGTVEPFDIYEFDARFQLLRQEDFGVDLAARGGVTWFEQEHDSDAAGGFGQLLATRRFHPRFTGGTGFLLHSDSTNDDKRVGDDDFSAALPLLAEIRLLSWLAFDAELSIGVGGFTADNPIFSLGPKIITNRHTFAILLSNSQYVSADGIVANTNRDDVVLGFAITRELGGAW